MWLSEKTVVTSPQCRVEVELRKPLGWPESTSRVGSSKNR